MEESTSSPGEVTAESGLRATATCSEMLLGSSASERGRMGVFSDERTWQRSFVLFAALLLLLGF